MDQDSFCVIVGSGMSGLLLGLKLKKLKINFVILEQLPHVGGTWYTNNYPGCCCDVKALSYLPLQYVKKFLPTREFSPSEEILEFLKVLTQEHDLEKHIKFNTRVTDCKYDEELNSWTVRTQQKKKKQEEQVWQCKYLLFANGPLSRPNKTGFPGLQDAFEGKWWHTSEWNWEETKHLEGKTVGVVGTGASAIQIIPELAERVGTNGKLVVFQRSPAYVFPRFDKALDENSLEFTDRMKFVQESRSVFNILADRQNYKMMNDKELNRETKNYNHAHIRSIVKDPKVAKQLSPDYAFGCKRPLLSDNYLETFNKSNVTLVPFAVESITKNGVKTKGGGSIEGIDILCLATGFKTGPIDDVNIHGLNGKSLMESYREQSSIHSNLGLCSSGFPNLFMILGPHSWTPHGNTSEAIDVQTSWVVSAIHKCILNNVERIEATPKAEKIWDQVCGGFTKDSVWTRCGPTWYTTFNDKPIMFTGRWFDFVNFLYQHGNKNWSLRDKEGRYLDSEKVLQNFEPSESQLPVRDREEFKLVTAAKL